MKNIALPSKRTSARLRAAEAGDDIYAGRVCKDCGDNKRKVESQDCVKCSDENSPVFEKRAQAIKDHMRDYNQKRYAGTDGMKLKMWESAKYRAKYRDQEFDIELDDIVIPEVCPVLGIPMDPPSLDRWDNSIGYTKDNIRVISKRANTLKSNMTPTEAKALLIYMETG